MNSTSQEWSFGDPRLCEKPSDSYDYCKARWSKTPVLYLHPHWTWPGREGQEISVWVHSNCDEVELLLNGISQGKQTTKPFEHLEWKVKYAPGRLVARACHRARSIEVVRETAGAPVAIRLTADRGELTADNTDLAVVVAEVVDESHRIVPVAGNKMTFKISGPAKLLGVGNGDPGCRGPDQADSSSVFNGQTQAIVQTTLERGAIHLEVESPGLKSASITLRSL